jgi:hypothetical protein
MNHNGASHSADHGAARIEDFDSGQVHGQDNGDDNSFVITAVGSLAAMGAAMAARSILKMAYRKATGAEPPAADDTRVSFGRALRWTLMTAATAAVIELVVQRAVAKAAESSHK